MILKVASPWQARYQKKPSSEAQVYNGEQSNDLDVSAISMFPDNDYTPILKEGQNEENDFEFVESEHTNDESASSSTEVKMNNAGEKLVKKLEKAAVS